MSTQTTSLTSELQNYFGFNSFKREQAIIQNVLDGNDTFVVMPTGGGKSMCYQLPALITGGLRHCYLTSHCFDEKPGRCY